MCTGDQEIGGMNTYTWELSHALAASDLCIDIYTRRHDTEQPRIVELSKHLRLIHLTAGSEQPLPLSTIATLTHEFTEQLLLFIVENKLCYTAFHCHYYLSGLIAVQYNQRTQKNIPVIMNFHTIERAKYFNNQTDHVNEYRNGIEQLLTQQVTYIIANSSSEHHHLQRFHQTPEDKIKIITPAINTSIFKPATDTLALSDRLHLLFVGRAQAIKGLDRLLEACQLLEEGMPGFLELTIVGEHRENIQSKIELFALHPSIHIVKQCKPEQLAKYYQSADLVVLPSYYESFGLVALEAIACGTPVIVTQHCGVAEMIEAHNRHCVIPSNAPHFIADVLLKFIEQPSLFTCNMNIAHYSWQNVAKQVAQLYQNLA